MYTLKKERIEIYKAIISNPEMMGALSDMFEQVLIRFDSLKGATEFETVYNVAEYEAQRNLLVRFNLITDAIAKNQVEYE